MAPSTFMSASDEGPGLPRLDLGFVASAEWARYERPMRRVLEHVYDHLDEPLNLAVLSDIACLSPHHWHRLYHAMAGETMAQTVKRLRLHRAAAQLAAGARPSRRLCTAAGFANAQAFTRAFKAVYGLAPDHYRDGGEHRRFEVGTRASETGGYTMDLGKAFEVAEVVLCAAQGLGVEHRGAYLSIGRAFDQLFARLAVLGLGRPGMRMLALFHDDPSSVKAADLRSTAVVLGSAPAPTGSGLDAVEIHAGSFVRLAHTGPYASMPAAYRWLFGHWLPTSGRQLGSGPVIEEYLNSPRQTAPRDLRTYLQVPLLPVEGLASALSEPMP